MTTIAERRARWTTPEGEARASALVERLNAREDVTDLAFGEIDGRLDFRGLTMARLRVEGAALRGWDARHARIGNAMFDRCTLADCRFDRAVLGPPGFYRSTVESCSFLGASLDLSLGIPWEPACRFRDTTFERANLYRTSAAGDFEDCDFTRTRCIKTDFSGSRLVRCSFADAELGEARFGHHWARDEVDGARDGRLDTCDFSGASMHWSEVYGLDVSSCTPPERTEAIFVAPLEPVALRGLEALEREPGDIANSLLGYLARQLDEMRPGQRSGVVATGCAAAVDRLEAIVRDARTRPEPERSDPSALPRGLRKVLRDVVLRPAATPEALAALRSYGPVPKDLAALVEAGDGLTARLADGGALVHLWPVEAWAVRATDPGTRFQPDGFIAIGVAGGRLVGFDRTARRPRVIQLGLGPLRDPPAFGARLADALPRVAAASRV